MTSPSATTRPSRDRSDIGVVAFVFLVLFTALPALAADGPATLLGDRLPSAILRTMPSHTPPNERLAGLPFIAGYEVIGTPVAIPPAEAATLAAALRSPTAFSGERNAEHMRPGVAYRFGTGAGAIDLLVCFSCDKVAFIPAGGENLGTEHLISQATRDALLGLAKKLLPNDEAIQALPRIRSKKAVPPPFAPVPKDAPKPGQPTAS